MEFMLAFIFFLTHDWKHSFSSMLQREQGSAGASADFQYFKVSDGLRLNLILMCPYIFLTTVVLEYVTAPPLLNILPV